MICISLNTLGCYDVRSIPLKWVKSYLQNRRQYVRINANISDLQAILCATPERSIFGPLLFRIYINDIFLSAPRFHLISLQITHVLLLKQKSKTTFKKL